MFITSLPDDVIVKESRQIFTPRQQSKTQERTENRENRSIDRQGYTYVGMPRELRCLRIIRSVAYQLNPGVL